MNSKQDIIEDLENTMIGLAIVMFSGIIAILTGSGAMFLSHLSGNTIESSILLGVVIGLIFGIAQAIDMTEEQLLGSLLDKYDLEAELVEENQEPETIRVEYNEE